MSMEGTGAFLNQTVPFPEHKVICTEGEGDMEMAGGGSLRSGSSSSSISSISTNSIPHIKTLKSATTPLCLFCSCRDKVHEAHSGTTW